MPANVPQPHLGGGGEGGKGLHNRANEEALSATQGQCSVDVWPAWQLLERQDQQLRRLTWAAAMVRVAGGWGCKGRQKGPG